MFLAEGSSKPDGDQKGVEGKKRSRRGNIYRKDNEGHRICQEKNPLFGNKFKQNLSASVSPEPSEARHVFGHKNQKKRILNYTRRGIDPCTNTQKTHAHDRYMHTQWLSAGLPEAKWH